MSEMKSPHKGLTRRSFLKTTGIMAGATAVGGGTSPFTALADTEVSSQGSRDEVFSGVCVANCVGHCRLFITKRDGKVVHTTQAPFPDEEYNRVCLKGLTHVQRIYGPKRLKYPLRRVVGSERGAGEWERISWDDAINEICSTWKKIIAESGSDAIAYFCNGGLRASGLIYQKFPALFEGISCSSCDDFAVNYMAPLALGSTPVQSGNEAKAMKWAKTIFVWGANPTDSAIQQWHFVLDAMENGARLIVIDPCYNTAASKADEYVPIKIGTDAVLAMAMTKYIIDSGLADDVFLKTDTVAPFLVKEDGTYLRAAEVGLGEDASFVVVDADGTVCLAQGATDPAIIGISDVKGIRVKTAYELLLDALSDYTPKKAEEICGISADKVCDLAELFVKGAPTTIFTQPGMDHYYNGHMAYFAMAALSMVSGQLGRPGAGWAYGYLEGWNINWAGVASGGKKTTKLKMPVMCVPEAVKTKSFAGNPVDIRSMFIVGKNVLANCMNRLEWIEAFNAMDFVVTADLELGDTAQYADIVLPIAHLFEGEDIDCVGGPHSFDIFQDKVMDPLYECKTDFEVGKLIIEGMGESVDAHTQAEWLDFALDTDMSKYAGISYASLKEQKIIDMIPASMRGEEGLSILGAGHSYKTATKRAQFYLEKVAPRMVTGVDFDPDIERLPHWEPPVEAGEDNSLAAKYPYVMVQQHTKWRVHASFSYSEWLRELDPEPIVFINPTDAEKEGVEEGDMVRISNDRGHVVVKAYHDHSLRPGVVNVPKGWQKDHFTDGHYQNLTHNTFHPFCVNHACFDVRVALERVS